MSTANGATALELQVLGKLSELSQQVGVVQAQTAQIIQEQGRAADVRRETYGKLNSLALVAAEVQRLSPLVDAHEIKHQRGLALGLAVNTAWLAISGCIGAVVTLVGNHFFNAPPQ